MAETPGQQLATLLAYAPGLLLVMARIGGLFIFAPFLSAAVIPLRIKAGVVLLTALAVYPTLTTRGVFDVPVELEVFSLLPLMVLEVTVGAAIGFFASLPILSLQIGGKMAGQQMGMGFAQIYNPATNTNDGILSQMLFFMILGTVLVAGGLEQMFGAVFDTFLWIEPGVFRVGGTTIDLITSMLLAAFEVGMRVATPVFAAVYLQSVAMGYLSKTTPQLNILSLGFPLRILIGITIVMVSLVPMETVGLDHWDESIALIHEWLRHGG